MRQEIQCTGVGLGLQGEKEGKGRRVPMAAGRQGSWEAAETLCGGGALVNLRPLFW